LVELVKVLVEGIPVELLINGSLRVETGCVENWSTSRTSLVSKVLPLYSKIVLLLDLFLFLNHTFLVSKNSCVPGSLLFEGRVLFQNSCNLFRGGVCDKSSAVVR